MTSFCHRLDFSIPEISRVGPIFLHMYDNVRCICFSLVFCKSFPIRWTCSRQNAEFVSVLLHSPRDILFRILNYEPLRMDASIYTRTSVSELLHKCKVFAKDPRENVRASWRKILLPPTHFVCETLSQIKISFPEWFSILKDIFDTKLFDFSVARVRVFRNRSA